jgi:hypothetical protein
LWHQECSCDKFAKEGAEVAIVYLSEHEDATKTKELIKGYNKEALTIATDISSEQNCRLPKNYL